ncbi:MAG: NAD(P)-dependent oxidoreductase [Candidatus Eremiobacteraeota bacterium]|nr:NAD(P)-dependent oxidoreductase [Candidatus Eremiobacteraeota bacterium]
MASSSARFARIMVVGAGGQLGTDLLRALADWNPVGLTHAEVSIEDPHSVRAALDVHRPDLVINTAAFHNVPVCEHEPMRALEINAVGVGALARACAERDCVFATFSTDYVFDGLKGAPYIEDDKPRPINAYGLSKLAGELIVQSVAPQHLIFRTSGLFGRVGSKSKGYTFIDRIFANRDRCRSADGRQRHDLFAILYAGRGCCGARRRSARRFRFVPYRECRLMYVVRVCA